MTFERLRTYGLVTIILLLIGSVLYLRRERRDAAALAPVLGEKDREKIVIDVRRATAVHVKRSGGSSNPSNSSQSGSGSAGRRETRTNLEGVRDLSITVSKEGEISLYAPTKGLTFEPGIGVLVSDKLYVGLDVQWAYWKRFGVLAGAAASTDRERSYRGYVAAGYSLPFRYVHNTMLLVGITTNKELCVGVRLRL